MLAGLYLNLVKWINFRIADVSTAVEFNAIMFYSKDSTKDLLLISIIII